MTLTPVYENRTCGMKYSWRRWPRCPEDDMLDVYRCQSTSTFIFKILGI
jgi:hypothetical protein